MPSFDFISSNEFRRALESDYSEMERCFETESWKSVQVLAGSIVEALLVDYLIATKDKRTGKDPLRLDLAEAVNICKSEGVLTERTADLSSVVRSYRNLIHPGRTVRLNEAPPNRASAQIAFSLVDLITEEVAKIRRNTFGLTAEQIVSKIERDPHSLSILKHLLTETTDQQIRRLVIDVLPTRYFEVVENDVLDFPDFGLEDRLKEAFNTAVEHATPATQHEVGSEFVRILREEDGTRVTAYGDAFFRAQRLRYIAEGQRGMVLEHLLSRMSPMITSQTLPMFRGISPYLEPSHVMQWIDPIVKTLASDGTASDTKQAVRSYYEYALMMTHDDVNEAILKRLQVWERHYTHRRSDAGAEVARALIAEIPEPAPADE